MLFKKRYFESELSKKLKNLTLYFLSNPVPFNGQDNEQKRGLELVTSRSSGEKTSSVKLIY